MPAAKHKTPLQIYRAKAHARDLADARQQVEVLAMKLATQYETETDKWVFAYDKVSSLMICDKLTKREINGLVTKFERLVENLLK